MYRTFRECCEYLAGVQAVDFFFAKECLVEITSKSKKLSYENQQTLFHLLMKLMSSYRDGHSCLNIQAISDKNIFSDIDEKKQGYSLQSYDKNLSLLDSLDYTNLPIFFAKEFNSLYIKRLWLFENEIAEFIKQRAKVKSLNLEHVSLAINKLFVGEGSQLNWQKVAVVNSLMRDFSIISGGPGTGKTTTITKLLLAIQIISSQTQKIALLAPTGKAAQRLTESIISSIDFLKSNNYLIAEEIYQNAQIQAQTIHRFLGLRPNSTHMKYDKSLSAPYDVVVVDEASMLDLDIFTKLIRALDKHTKLILLGDINQLPSVGVGNLLNDLVDTKSNSFTKKALDTLQQITKYNLSQTQENDYVVKLEKNYRSQRNIANFAKDILKGNIEIQQHQNDSLNFLEYKFLDNYLKKFAQRYKSLSKKNTYREALDELKKFRILVANKNFDIGTQRLNIKIEQILGKRTDSNYKAKPIMIVENSYSLGLFNGDVGIIWPDDKGILRAYFEHKSDKFFSLNMLPKFEAVYAMTIHKTQGSEFDEVVMFLPNDINKVLTKELIYTGVTRAKHKLSIVANISTLERIAKTTISRSSNIRKLLKD